MHTADFIRAVSNRYAIEPDYPWAKYPDYAVFRHSYNKKWFCLVMQVPASKLGLPGSETMGIVNIKARPDLVSTLRMVPGVLPAYHMNKTHWLTLLLQGGLSKDEILGLVDESFNQTA